MFQVRFHLGAGEHYAHWQIKNRETDDVVYYDPSKVQLILYECELRNNVKTANKICNGESNKTVCAWVRCKTYAVNTGEPLSVRLGSFLNYNPRHRPFWTGEKHGTDISIDGETLEDIVSSGKSLFGNVFAMID